MTHLIDTVKRSSFERLSPAFTNLSAHTPSVAINGISPRSTKAIILAQISK